MADTLEKYHSILSHIESLGMSEGEYLELANVIRDIRNKNSGTKEEPWTTISLEIVFSDFKTSDMYKSISMYIHSFKKTNFNKIAIKATMKFNPVDELMQIEEIESHDYKITLNTIYELYHPSKLLYKVDGFSNHIDCYTHLAKYKQHQKKLHEEDLTAYDPEEEDDEEEYTDDYTYSALWIGFRTLVKIIGNRFYTKTSIMGGHPLAIQLI